MSEGYIAKLQKKCYSKLEDFDNELQKKRLFLIKVLLGIEISETM